MPQRILCRRCGATLYESYEVIEPIDILTRYNSTCPGCGKRMEYTVDKIKISLFNPSVVEAI
ncbi:hypothetical protein [[Eubacterium] cellulosolvens]